MTEIDMYVTKTVPLALLNYSARDSCSDTDSCSEDVGLQHSLVRC